STLVLMIPSSQSIPSLTPLRSPIEPIETRVERRDHDACTVVSGLHPRLDAHVPGQPHLGGHRLESWLFQRTIHPSPPSTAMTGAEGVNAIVGAIDTDGYRLLDTAVNYENEREVGEAIANSAVDREKLFVTSKIPGRHHGFDESIASTEESLARLGLDYLDLHLIHWPNPSVGKYVETWRGLIELRERGLVKSIGVSNFTEAMLTELIDATGVTPAVNQVELHPYFPQADLIAFHRTIGVQTEAWSPLY